MTTRYKKYTLAEARDALRAAGMTVTRDTASSGPTGSGEYRVTFRVGPGMSWERAEELAHYTADLGDAVATGLAMSKRNTGA